jgi:hypothetical protein
MYSGLFCRVVWWKFTDVSETLTASIVGEMRETEGTSETSVKFYQTTRRNSSQIICILAAVRT